MSSFYRGGDAGRRANFLKTCSRSSAICRLTECSGGCDEVGPSRFEALLAVRAEREHRDAAKSVARTERTPRFPWALGAGDDRTLKPIAGGVGVGHCRCGGATGVSRNPPEWADARPCMSWTFSVAFGPRLARKCRIRPTVHTARGSGWRPTAERAEVDSLETTTDRASCSVPQPPTRRKGAGNQQHVRRNMTVFETFSGPSFHV